MQRELWRNKWLSCINELTSLELQKKSRPDLTNTNPHWSFVEFMCCYFDDLYIANNYGHQINKGWISKNEFKIIEAWHKLLDRYNAPMNDDYDVKAILMDKDWHLIVEQGQNAKKGLSVILSDEERKILNEKIDYTQHQQS